MYPRGNPMIICTSVFCAAIVCLVCSRLILSHANSRISPNLELRPASFPVPPRSSQGYVWYVCLLINLVRGEVDTSTAASKTALLHVYSAATSWTTKEYDSRRHRMQLAGNLRRICERARSSRADGVWKSFTLEAQTRLWPISAFQRTGVLMNSRNG